MAERLGPYRGRHRNSEVPKTSKTRKTMHVVLAAAELAGVAPRTAAPSPAEVFAQGASNPITLHETASPTMHSGIDLQTGIITIRNIIGTQETSAATQSRPSRPVEAPLAAQISPGNPVRPTSQTQEQRVNTVRAPGQTTRLTADIDAQAQGASTSTQDKEPTISVKVKKGDSLWKIAERLLEKAGDKKASKAAKNAAMHLLIGLNDKLKNPNLIFPGKTITAFKAQLMLAADKLRTTDLQKGTQAEIITLQKDLRHSDNYQAHTPVSSSAVRTNDQHEVRAAETLISDAQKPGKTRTDLKNNGITLSKIRSTIANHGNEQQTITTADVRPDTPYITRPTFVDASSDVLANLATSARATATEKLLSQGREIVITPRSTVLVDRLAAPSSVNEVQFGQDVKTAEATRMVNPHEKLGKEYSSIWNKLAAKEILGRKLTVPEINLITHFIIGLNKQGITTTLNANSQYSGLSEEAIIALAGFAHLPPKDFDNFSTNLALPSEVTQAMAPIAGLLTINQRAPLTAAQEWHSDHKIVANALGVLNKLYPLLSKYQARFAEIFKDPTTAPQLLGSFFSEEAVQKALGAKIGGNYVNYRPTYV
jgi:LysM domain-containing protein